MIMEETLIQIGRRNKCDKISKSHPKTHHYLRDIYPPYFEPLQNETLKILEIGVKFGGSLRTWRDFFPYAQIYGIEIQERLAFEEERIKVFTGDQSDTAFLNLVVNETGLLDIIIDDGGHLSSLIVSSFLYLWKFLNPGGHYFIEDVWYTCLNDRKHSDPMKKEIWRMLQDLSRDCCRLKNSSKWDINSNEIDFVHFWRHVAVLKKRDCV
jgi:hypothetical protein